MPCRARDDADSFAGTYTGGNATTCEVCAAGRHDFDYDPGTPCCPRFCRQGCVHRAESGEVRNYPGDCVEFLVERSTVSSAQGGRRWLAGLCWMCSVLLLAQG